MASPDGRVVIVFNGEIYDYRELRERLMERGHTFSGASDTEVLLRLYLDEGPAHAASVRALRRIMTRLDPSGTVLRYSGEVPLATSRRATPRLTSSYSRRAARACR